MKSNTLIFSLFFGGIILVIFFSCQPPQIISKQPSTNTSATPSVSSVNKNLLTQLINNVRQQGCNCGTTKMPPVSDITWNSQLEVAALKHVKDINQKKIFSHIGLDGADPGDRIIRAGYSWRTFGENIANGYQNEQAVVAGWLKSVGHCKNIMNSAYKEMGVAKSGIYWVQVFATKR